MTSEKRAAGLVVLAACGYGTLSVGTVLAERYGVGFPALMAWRYIIAAPLIALLAGGFSELKADPKKVLLLLTIGIFGQTAVTWLTLSALEWLSAAAVGFLFFTYPVWVAIFAAAAGLERLTGIRVAALALAVGGITLMVGAPWAMPLPLPGVLRALGAAVVWAISIPALHYVRGNLNAAAASTYVIVGAAFSFTAYSLWSGTLFGEMNWQGWGIAVVLAIFGTVVAFVAFLKGMSVLGPVRAAILATAEPFWTALLGAILIAQPVGINTIAGGCCIVAAILLLQRKSAAHKSQILQD